jgi:hypothetical protein
MKATMSAFIRPRANEHPDTQAWKRAALRRAGLAEPANLRFKAVDPSVTAMGDLTLRHLPPGTGSASRCTCHATRRWPRVELFDADRLRDRYLRERPELPMKASTLLAVATV